MKALEKIILTGRALVLGATLATSCMPNPSYIRRTYTGTEQQRDTAYATIEKYFEKVVESLIWMSKDFIARLVILSVIFDGMKLKGLLFCTKRT